MTEVREGDWVRVYGQVTDSSPHPEEYTVRFQSHNEDYYGLVRRDWCERVDPPFAEGIAYRCGSLLLLTTADDQYLRCASHVDHGDDHGVKGVTWSDDQASGCMEVG